MLPKETQSLIEMKDLFTVVASSFRKEVHRLSDFALSEIVELLANQGGADAMIQSHHAQAQVWNSFVNMVSQYFQPSGSVLQGWE